MSQLFSIEDDKIVINKLALTSLEGDITHAGSVVRNGDETIKGELSVSGNGTVAGDLTVQKKLIVDVIQANQIINNNISGAAVDGSQKFLGADEGALNGQGLVWSTLNEEKQLIYRSGQRLWTNMTLDLEPGKSYQINNIDVLTNNTLGSGIWRSSLRQLAPLNNLTVVGNTNLGDLLIVDNDIMRVGIGTESPNAAFSVVDNNIEVVLGSTADGKAVVGSFTNNELVIVTDNIPRISLKGSEVTVGGRNQTPSEFRVHGTIYANAIITEQSPEDTSVKLTNENNKAVSPLEISAPGYWTEGEQVLTKTTLGSSVTNSNLTSVGTLNELTVSGKSNFTDITTHTLITDAFVAGRFSLVNDSITIDGKNALQVSEEAVVVGNVLETGRPLKLFGNVSININNPDPTLGLNVSGNLGFAGRRFIAGDEAPLHGSFNKGDVCWSNNPTSGGYMGWVCVVTGTPGEWLPFGLIG